ncbi:MAG: lantibiotic dehydratase, partial [Lewinella sp.]|nr:lantibiotic dehydratase [Lewinella sp.]
QALIKVRRDLFNDRCLEAGMKELVELNLSKDNLAYWKVYLQQVASRKILRASIHDQFREYLDSTRVLIQNASTSEALLKGLNFASDHLLDQIKKYTQTPSNDFKKKELHIEKGVIKYLTRIAFKTSPFSTFTNISSLDLSQAPPTNPGISTKKKIKSTVKLNTLLFKSLMDLFYVYVPIRRYLMVEINPTLEKKEGQYLFIINVSDIESVQKLNQNPVLVFIEELLKKRRISFGELVAVLVEQTEESVEACEIYTRDLVALGFIELKTGISGLDPEWDSKLFSFLQIDELKNDLIVSRIIALLNDLQRVKKQLEIEHYAERKKLLSESYQKVIDLFEFYNSVVQNRQSSQETHIQSKQFFGKGERISFSLKKNNIFYEDTSFQNDHFLDIKQTQTIIGLIAQLAEYAYPLRYDLDYERLKQFYRDRYGIRSTSIVTLYHDYFQEVLIPIESYEKSENKLSEEEPNYFHLPSQQNYAILRQRWSNALLQVLAPAQNGEINISKKHLDEAQKHCEVEHTSIPNDSLATFVQIYQGNKGKYKAFTKSLTIGYGRFYSRFLDILPKEVAEEMKEKNRSKTKKDVLHLENLGATYFNANIHATLMDREVKSPGNHNFLPADQQIPLSGIHVQVADDGELILVEKNSGKKVKIYDLCFQGQDSRPKLFRLLHNFSPVKHVNIYGLYAPINQHFEKSAKHTAHPDTVFFPRITFEEQIILQRKAWVFQPDSIPQRMPQQEDVDYFLSLKNWLEFHKIPDEVFVCLSNTRQFTKETNRLTRDDYKPQYIDFNNPTLCLFFERIVKKVSTALRVEEMLPNSEQACQFSNSHNIYEYLFQWY